MCLCLLSVGISSFFSYPFRYTIILLLCLWCIACTARMITGSGFIRIFRLHGAVRVGIIFCLGGVLYFTAQDVIFEYRWGRLVTDFEECHTSSKQAYRELHDAWNGNPAFLYNYGYVLSDAGANKEAVSVLLDCERRFNDYDVQILLGDNYLRMGDYINAETHYIEASQMCPNRFMPLYRLVGIYDSLGRPDRALELAKEIVVKPAKIPSATVTVIKMQMQKRVADQ